MRKHLSTLAIVTVAAAALAACDNVTVISQEDLDACQDLGAAAIESNTLTVKVDSADQAADMAACLDEHTTAPDGSYELLTDSANTAALTGEGLQIDIGSWSVVSGTPSPDWEINIG
ncbi:hypothetical protein QQX09_04615 [Demequina sp. SYSU T00192]|uniref:Secreted protein n=1 Tax=Demequina litoralis TaxID=3051660 RepID=A0ABT8G7K8_9MICO|nr:hypothetical protein [Demequina sp. SYSU T00192]MDN4475140.1 hypothetical protein [Demequina sp. SYSU T00192]